jgi:predicted metal-binding membrane protein
MASERSVAATPAPLAREQRSLFIALFSLLVIAAWAALWLWSTSPYGRYLEHGRWGEAGVLGALCRTVPQGEFIIPALLHAMSWVLMVAAMMLPTTYPLLAMFRRITGARADSGSLTTLVILGFFVAWSAFGVFAHVADAGLQQAAARSAWFVAYGWMAGAVMLAAAGLFQFSALKYRCLEQCRTPFAFVGARWRGRTPARDAFRIGVDHGLYCVGCCWALMLVMFVVGIGSVGWMLVLAAVMAAEKNLPGGRRLRTPLGLGLIGWAGAIIIAHA